MNKERSLIYISGKISAHTEEGVQANLDHMLEAGVEHKLDRPEVEIYLPGEANQRLGQALNFEWKDYLRADLSVLKRCDTIYMCEGWEDSRGARMEKWLAGKWGIPVEYEIEEGLDYSLIQQ